MNSRLAILLCLASLLAGCMSHTSGMNPLSTAQGREDARDAYIQLGIGYLQKGAAERAKEPLSKALEIDPNHAGAHAALALVFQTQMEPALADQHFRKALALRPGMRASSTTTALSCSSRSSTSRPMSATGRPARTPSIPSARGCSRIWA